MAHQFNSMRADKMMKSRVGKITAACGGGFASGGGVHSDVKADKSLVKKMVKSTALKLAGGSVNERADKPNRARGGKVGKHKKSGGSKHVTNVIVAPSGPKPPMMPPVPGVAGGPPPMPPRPMGGPPPGMPSVAPGGPPQPPGAAGPMPMRAKGGRVKKAEGGMVDQARKDVDAAWENRNKGGVKTTSEDRDAMDRIQRNAGAEKAAQKEWDQPTPYNVKRARGGSISDASRGATPVQHSPNKDDGKNIGRGPVVTRATGGAIEAHGKMAPHAKGGAGGGNSRLDKDHHPAKYGA